MGLGREARERSDYTSSTHLISRLETEINTKRQATQHGCLPSLLGDGDKDIEVVYGEEKIFGTGPTRADKAEKKSLVPARQAQ